MSRSRGRGSGRESQGRSRGAPPSRDLSRSGTSRWESRRPRDTCLWTARSRYAVSRVLLAVAVLAVWVCMSCLPPRLSGSTRCFANRVPSPFATVFRALASGSCPFVSRYDSPPCPFGHADTQWHDGHREMTFVPAWPGGCEGLHPNPITGGERHGHRKTENASSSASQTTPAMIGRVSPLRWPTRRYPRGSKSGSS